MQQRSPFESIEPPQAVTFAIDSHGAELASIVSISSAFRHMHSRSKQRASMWLLCYSPCTPPEASHYRWVPVHSTRPAPKHMQVYTYVTRGWPREAVKGVEARVSGGGTSFYADWPMRRCCYRANRQESGWVLTFAFRIQNRNRE